MNSASVELDAVMVWVLLSHAVAPPENVETHPVIDLHFWRSEPEPSSTKPINLGWETFTVKSPTAWGRGAGSWQSELGGSFENSSFGPPFLMPHDFVVWRCFVRPFNG